MSTPPTTREVDDPRAPEELRAALHSARAAGPSPAHLARLREATLQRAAAQLAAGAPMGGEVPAPGGTGTAGRLPTTGGWTGKLLVVGALVGAGMGAWFWQRTPAPPQTAPVEAPAAARPSVSPGAPMPSHPVVAAPEAEPDVAPEALDQPDPPTAEPRAPRRAARPRRKPAHRGASAEPGLERSLSEEIALLGKARQALQDRPAETQRLAEEHARFFPHGRFVQEREVLAVHALLRQGALDEALRRGRRFLATYPDSTHARRVAALLQDAAR